MSDTLKACPHCGFHATIRDENNAIPFSPSKKSKGLSLKWPLIIGVAMIFVFVCANFHKFTEKVKREDAQTSRQQQY